MNHRLIIDHWTSHTTGEDKGTISLTANKSYDIQVEAWDNTGTAKAQLKWSSTKVAKGTIPSARLTPAAQNLNSMLDDDLVFASSQLKQTMTDLGNNTSKFVNRTGSNGKWNVVTANDWTSGFLAGQFWEMYNATGNTFWSDKAKLSDHATGQPDVSDRRSGVSIDDDIQTALSINRQRAIQTGSARRSSVETDDVE